MPTHDSFTLVRTYSVTRTTLYGLWADPDLKRKWFADNDGPTWETLEYGLDFRVGGREFGSWRMDASEDRPIAGVISNETTFLEIVDRECILFAYTMANDGKVFSDSLTTVTFEDVVGGTRLSLVEQMSILGGSDDISSRKNGWAWLLDNIEKAQAEVDA